MKIFDIIALCRQNLSRQKARTRLTVMGVTIGCCAIVLMMSLGIGSNEQTKVMLSNMGDLTAIEIWNYGGADRGNAVTERTLDTIRAIDNVDMVSPKKEFNEGNIKIVSGAGDRYSTSYAQICGIDEQMLEKSGYKLKEGEYLKNTGSGFGRKPVNVVVGERFFYEFMDTKRPAGKNRRSFDDQSKYNGYDSYMEENVSEEEAKPFEEPFFDSIDSKLYLTIETYSDDQEEPKKFRQELKIVGILKRDTSKDYYTSSGVYMSISDMDSIMKAVMSKKEYTEMMKQGYERVLVKAKEIKDVSAIEKSIKAMGYDTSSMESIRESINKQTRQQQIMLAGLGGISLFVAAIGIMNTMIMSITERTKEIGIMKALGCYVNDIRKLFLFEAGAIGFIGGVVGVLISIFISFLINVAGILGLVQSNSSSMFDYGAAGETPSFFDKLANINLDFNAIYVGLTTAGSRTSIIPVWLIIFGLIFSTLIGLISGYHPANKAVKIPALEAIKHE